VTAGSVEKCERCLALGADVAVNYRHEGHRKEKLRFSARPMSARSVTQEPSEAMKPHIGTLDLLQAVLEEALREAQASGKLAAAKSPAELSRALTNAVIGLAVTGRLQLQSDAVGQIDVGTLSMLD
jgi:hypothetical protein